MKPTVTLIMEVVLFLAIGTTIVSFKDSNAIAEMATTGMGPSGTTSSSTSSSSLGSSTGSTLGNSGSSNQDNSDSFFDRNTSTMGTNISTGMGSSTTSGLSTTTNAQDRNNSFGSDNTIRANTRTSSDMDATGRNTGTNTSDPNLDANSGFTPLPESHIRQGMDEWLVLSGVSPGRLEEPWWVKPCPSGHGAPRAIRSPKI